MNKENVYKREICHGHPRADYKGLVYQHVLVMERYLSEKYGRPIFIWGRYWDIHHKNGRKYDNRIENLELFSKPKHTQFHRDLERQEFTCSRCGSNKSYLEKGKKSSQQHWYNDTTTGLKLCKKCWKRVKYNYHPKDKDMTERRCSKCGSDKTDIQVIKMGPRPHWRIDTNTGLFICGKCYQRDRKKV